jgi:hypothetical protein
MTVSRRVRRQGDEILLEWGGYVRTYAQAQGGLQRLVSGDLADALDAKLTRRPGGHSDPVFANLAAEEALQIRRVSSFDRMMRGYPVLWRQLATAMFVECMSMERVAAAVALPVRHAEGALALLRRQAEVDWAHTALMSCREKPEKAVVAKRACLSANKE